MIYGETESDDENHVHTLTKIKNIIMVAQLSKWLMGCSTMDKFQDMQLKNHMQSGQSIFSKVFKGNYLFTSPLLWMIH